MKWSPVWPMSREHILFLILFIYLFISSSKPLYDQFHAWNPLHGWFHLIQAQPSRCNIERFSYTSEMLHHVWGHSWLAFFSNFSYFFHYIFSIFSREIQRRTHQVVVFLLPIFATTIFLNSWCCPIATSSLIPKGSARPQLEFD